MADVITFFWLCQRKSDAVIDNARAFQAGTNRIGGAEYQGDAAVQIAAKGELCAGEFCNKQ